MTVVMTIVVVVVVSLLSGIVELLAGCCCCGCWLGIVMPLLLGWWRVWLAGSRGCVVCADGSGSGSGRCGRSIGERDVLERNGAVEEDGRLIG